MHESEIAYILNVAQRTEFPRLLKLRLVGEELRDVRAQALREAADIAAHGDIHEAPLVLEFEPTDDEAGVRAAVHATLLKMAEEVEKS